MKEILQIAIEDSTFFTALQVAKMQLVATERVLQTQVRVDEAKLRRRQLDILPRLLAMIAEEKAAMGLVVEGEALP